MKQLENMRFGKLTALYRSTNHGRGTYSWKCRCDCGTECNVKQYYLTNGTKIHCGCGLDGRIYDITGQKFNRLLVIEFAGRKNEMAIWKCLCDCGNIKIVSGYDLRRNGVKSCGCLFEETRADLGKKLRVWHSNEDNYQTYKQSLPKGPEHHHYNPNKIRKLSRDEDKKSTQYKEWRRIVFKRDNYTCQKCGMKSKNLRSHHILSYHLYIDLRYNVDNGICLCENCHNNYHKQYGKKNDCNQITLIEYLNTPNNI